MMKNYPVNILRSMMFILAITLTQPTFAANESATSNMEILAQKVKADKKLVIAANMELTDSEAKAFWPIYDAYQEDLQKINQRLADLINNYSLAYNVGAVLDDTAKALLNEAIAIELAEANLKKSYVPKLTKVLPAAKAARYLQIENKIRALVRYQLAEAIPLAR